MVVPKEKTVVKSLEDLETINETINILAINEITPYYLSMTRNAVIVKRKPQN
mgnify:CR=1 FL=1